MGFIAQSLSKDLPPLPGREDRARLWREAFGRATDKEAGLRDRPRVEPGGTWNKSTAAQAATARLLTALRSRAPGGWSDDRWEQVARHYVGITYVAVHRQNELLTQAEFQVFKKDRSHPDGKRPVTEDDPPDGDRGKYDVRPYDLVRLLERPNNEDSFGDLMAQWNLQLDLTGSVLTWLVPNRVETPMELYPVSTGLAIPQPVSSPDYPHGAWRVQPVYPYGPFSSYPVPNSATGALLPAQWVMRFKYPHPFLRYDGYSPQTGLRFHLDALEMIDRSRHYSMRRQIHPSAVVNMENADGAQPLPPEEIERIKAEIEATFMGPENAGNLMVMYPGCSLDQFGAVPTDMDYQGGWDQLMGFNLGGYGVTKPAAGLIDDTSYSTLFASLKQLYWLTLDPKCARVGTRLSRDVGPFFGDDLIVEVRCKRIDDHEIAFNKVDRGIAGRCITKNEERKLMDMPLTLEVWGADIAGDPSPNELAQAQAQMAQEQRLAAAQAPPGQPGAEQPASEGDALLEAIGAGDEGAQPEGLEAGRPGPDALGEGSLGPRKSLRLPAWVETGRRRKSLYDHVTEALSNGNGHH